MGRMYHLLMISFIFVLRHLQVGWPQMLYLSPNTSLHNTIRVTYVLLDLFSQLNIEDDWLLRLEVLLS